MELHVPGVGQRPGKRKVTRLRKDLEWEIF
jgi:hypothetical protein